MILSAWLLALRYVATELETELIVTIGYVITGVGIMVGFITKVFDHLQQARLEEVRKRNTPPSP